MEKTQLHGDPFPVYPKTGPAHTIDDPISPLDDPRIYIGKQAPFSAVTMVSDSHSNILPIRT